MARYIGILCCGNPFQFPGFKVVFIENDIPEQSLTGSDQDLRDLTETELGYVEQAGYALGNAIGVIRMERSHADLDLDDYDELVAIPLRPGRDRHSCLCAAPGATLSAASPVPLVTEQMSPAESLTEPSRGATPRN
jgi:hypothetical protein